MGDVGEKGGRGGGVAGYLVCAAGLVLVCAAFYPGYMSQDSGAQWAEGRAWRFSDWHPPLMAAVWGVVDRVVAGPAGMLVLHNAMFWGACALLWRATRGRSKWLAVALCAFGFLPQVLSHLSTVWKDAGLGAALLLAAALLYTSFRTGSRAALVAALPPLFYGFGVRLNAAPAVLPLALWAGVLGCRAVPAFRDGAARRGRLAGVAVGLALFASLWAATWLTTEALVGGRHSYTGQSVLLHDLAAVSVARGEPLFPDYILRDAGFSMEKVTKAYSPDIATPILPGGLSGLRLSADAGEMEALRARWLEVVAANPGAYLRHRWGVFRQASGLGGLSVCFPYQMAGYQPRGFETRDWLAHRLLKSYFWAVRDSFLFRGFFWLLLSAVLVFFAARGRMQSDLEFVFVLASSGLLYGAAYFLIAPSCDFRFFWWTMLSASVGSAFMVSHAARTRAAKGAPAGPAPDAA